MSSCRWLSLFKVCVGMHTHIPMNAYVHMCAHKNTHSYTDTHTQLQMAGSLPSAARGYTGVILSGYDENTVE